MVDKLTDVGVFDGGRDEIDNSSECGGLKSRIQMKTRTQIFPNLNPNPNPSTNPQPNPNPYPNTKPQPNPNPNFTNWEVAK